MSGNTTGDLVTFGPDANCTFELCTIDQTVFGYRPSIPANAIFIAIFAVAGLVHIALGIHWRSWWFMWCMILGCVDEIVGYAGRIMMYNNPWDFNGFMVQIVCIGTAPIFYCAAIYVILSQTITSFSPSLARFPPKLIFWTFLPCDLVSLLLQGVGGGLSATTTGSSRAGVDISLAGLACQVFTLLVFSVLYVDHAVRYLRRYRQQHKDADAPVGGHRRLFVFFAALALAVALILARCAYRLQELSEGYEGEAIRNEGLFIGLEGVLMSIAVFTLCIAHPGVIFNRPDVDYRLTGEAGLEVGVRADMTSNTAHPTERKLSDPASESSF